MSTVCGGPISLSSMLETRPLGSTETAVRPGRLVIHHDGGADMPGRRFPPTAERELYPALQELAAFLPGCCSGVLLIAEMPGPRGLPDLVAVPIGEELGRRLSHSCPPLLNWNDARLVAACTTLRPTSVEVLARRLGHDVEGTRRRVRRLIQQTALLQVGSGYVRCKAMQPVGRIYALEAKVDDWCGGLGQALRYGTWADAATLVVSRLPRDPSRAVAQAQRLGLGLAVGRRWLVRPTIRPLSRAQRLWSSEHVVATLTAEARGQAS